MSEESYFLEGLDAPENSPRNQVPESSRIRLPTPQLMHREFILGQTLMNRGDHCLSSDDITMCVLCQSWSTRWGLTNWQIKYCFPAAGFSHISICLAPHITYDVRFGASGCGLAKLHRPEVLYPNLAHCKLL